MGMKIVTEKDESPRMIATLEELMGSKVNVGCLDGEHAYLAAIHEYGATIRPKNAQYLTIPCNPKAKGKKASSFNDLYTLRLDSGELFLVRNKGKDKLEFMYWLTKSVTIPARPFLAPGHDEYAEQVVDKWKTALGQVIGGKMSIDQYLDGIGQELASRIKTYARNLNSPADSRITQEAKGSSNPLVDTGNMIEGITWEVEW